MSKREYKPHQHSIDWITDYCVLCGKSEKDIEEENLDCITNNKNITAISHIIVRRAILDNGVIKDHLPDERKL